MKVHFWVIGKQLIIPIPGIEEYIKRLKRYCQFEYIELPAAKIGKMQLNKIRNQRGYSCIENFKKAISLQ